MKDNTEQILNDINATLKEINSRQKINEEFSETDKLLEKVDCRVEYSTQQIQNSFNRIHDKVFNFNNILIATYLVLGTFPSDSPMMQLWTVVFPILNLIFMIILEVRQMEIHRFASREEEWTDLDRNKFGKKLDSQTFLSLLSFALSLGCLLYLILSVV